MASTCILACFLSLFFFCSCIPVNPEPKPKFPYQVKYFEQYVDHFNEVSYKDKTFKQKYLYSDKHWKAGGPIFFCIGNQGAIESFWNVFGFVHELATEIGAAVVFAEHRFFGSSMPFNKDSLKTPYIGALSMEQALADYAVLIDEILRTSNLTNSKVITIGGSYGGILAAYMRLKYPDLVHGALASSAPIYMQDPTTKRDFFFPRVTEIFKDTSKFCVDLTVRVLAIAELLAKEESGLKALGRYFKLCEPLKDQDDFYNFQGWVRHGFVSLAMMNYPYPTNFVGHLPANPVHAACKALIDNHNPIYGLGDLVGIYYNDTQKLDCFNISDEYVQCSDPSGCSAKPDDISWDFLTCTEVQSPDSSNGVTDMFPNMPWDDHMKAEYCLKKYGVLPRHGWPSVEFWGKHLKTISNIIFSNGDLDPWRMGGVLEDVSDTVVAINVTGGARHLDLLGSNEVDPSGVTEARLKEKAIIQKWIKN